MTFLNEALPRGPRTIETQELRRLFNRRDVTVVDVRPTAAYNGWRLSGEPRGGHIPGAVAFPARWVNGVESAEVRRLLTSKGVIGAPTVVVYGSDGTDAAALAVLLSQLGHGDVCVYERGFAAWAAGEALPIERLPRYDKLVHPEWVSQVLAGERPEASPDGRFLLFHVNFGVPEEYEEGHLPSALYLDTNRLEDPADWNRRSPDAIEATLAQLGIGPDATVVLYGRDTVGHANEKWPGRRAGQIAATRAAIILLYAGVKDVRVLDGGYDAWVNSGYPIDTVPHVPSPIQDFGVTIPEHPEYIVDIEEAKSILADDGSVLVSVRTWKEHIGLVSGYNYIAPAGRIAGDVWGNCGSDAYHMQHYRTVDNTMRAYPEIAANWAEAGITPDKRVAFYCGTGWRAAETWFYAYLMGWERIAVYDGGWFEWSKDPINNPVEVGEVEDEDEAAA
jgi:thiosulfate/3-mercaptopyruvate sulfurtransferase